jgi:hypothetical protein
MQLAIARLLLASVGCGMTARSARLVLAVRRLVARNTPGTYPGWQR